MAQVPQALAELQIFPPHPPPLTTPCEAMLFGNGSADLGKSTDPDDDLYEDFNYR